MKKQGFTLVELLAAIVILGLIVTIVYPVIISTIHSSEKKAHDSQVKIVEEAIKLYYLEHVSELKDLDENGEVAGCTGDFVNALNSSPVSIDTLVEQGYISDNELREDNNGHKRLIDPCTDEPIQGTISVKWICNMKQYEYKFDANACDY